jgi:hypothetical protein
MPQLPDLEAVLEYGLASGAGGMRVFADLWDVERFFDCGCSGHRAARLRVMNREQRVPPQVVCAWQPSWTALKRSGRHPRPDRPYDDVEAASGFSHFNP